MKMQPREIEFKFAVHNACAFPRLIQYLGMPLKLLESGVFQVNHFFDTESLSLYSAGSMVRLREHSGRFTLTVKQMSAADSGESVLSNRIELEMFCIFRAPYIRILKKSNRNSVVVST